MFHVFFFEIERAQIQGGEDAAFGRKELHFAVNCHEMGAHGVENVFRDRRGRLRPVVAGTVSTHPPG